MGRLWLVCVDVDVFLLGGVGVMLWAQFTAGRLMLWWLLYFAFAFAFAPPLVYEAIDQTINAIGLQLQGCEKRAGGEGEHAKHGCWNSRAGTCFFLTPLGGVLLWRARWDRYKRLGYRIKTDQTSHLC